MAQSPVTDASGREIRPPAKVERVYAAGPPAGVLVFAIAPDKLTGWTRAMRPNEAAFFAERHAQLPELGRLTGRGNTANVEVLLKARTDLIVDVGSTGEPYASLASQVQKQTGIPYALLDGRIEATPATLRALGKLMGNDAEPLALWYERELVEHACRNARGIEGSVEAIAADVKRRGEVPINQPSGAGTNDRIPLKAAWRLSALAQALEIDPALLPRSAAEDLLRQVWRRHRLRERS